MTDELNFKRTSDTVVHAFNWPHVVVYGLLPGLAFVLAMTAGYLKWQESSVRDFDVAAVESVQAAKDSTIALLSYQPDTVEHDLDAASNRTTGPFRDSYIKLTNEVVIPGAKEKQIATTVTIPAASPVSATENHALVLIFVNQTVTMGTDAPTDSASSVRVSLDKVGDRWLVSGFDPV